MTKKPMRRWIARCPLLIYKRYIVLGRTKAEATANLRDGIVDEPLDDNLDAREGVGKIVAEY